MSTQTLQLRLKAKLTAIRAIRHKSTLDDAAYRALLMRVAGVDSSTKLTRLTQAEAVLAEFDRLGLNPKGSRPAKAKAPARQDNPWAFVFGLPADRQAMARKIYRLAQRVGGIMSPAMPVAPKAYIEGISKQMAGCDQPLEFCDPERLHKIVQALEVYCKRHGG